MKVILKKDVAKLGKKFDIKEVSSGHALNLLIPQGLAITATEESIKKMELEKAKYAGEKKIHEDLILKNIKDLDGISITLKGKANEKGHLFAGIHKEEVVAEIEKQTQLQIDPSFIIMEHPIKEVGEYTLKASAANKTANFKIIVSAK